MISNNQLKDQLKRIIQKRKEKYVTAENILTHTEKAMRNLVIKIDTRKNGRDNLQVIERASREWK